MIERASSNTSEKAKDPKDRGFASLAYLETYCKAACDEYGCVNSVIHEDFSCQIWDMDFSGNSEIFFCLDLIMNQIIAISILSQEALSTSQTARTFWQRSVQFPELDMAMQIWT
ncbi:hypothetical protein RhiirA1_532128 [Rhizophagus irregularis]|uniref:Uncharacterized protein n=1 Tax=Rhizophagus irregularis TaxID=588596 RepID=A0A2N0S6P6_9GLOM|nr:hypothetical protein RhiirA1_532128 [Rhizophagus irregularis]